MYIRGLAIIASSVAGLVLAASAQAQNVPSPLPCSSCFIGKLKLISNPADPAGKTRLLDEDLFFVDPDKVVWKAGKGDVTDGASIPELFQPIVGGPWESAYLPAAVMHDHYTNVNHIVRPWRDTVVMFYQAMLVNQVDVIKAKLMYYAVYAFGPHWDKISQGVPCGHNCTFSQALKMAHQPAQYSVSATPELNEIKLAIESSELRGKPLSLNDLALIATTKHSSNIFIVTDTTR